MKHWMLILLGLSLSQFVIAQPDRWQQRVSYKMTIDMDAERHQYSGTQQLKYTNNSPEVLDKVFYHLYFNAFQPGSMMDVRNTHIVDPDKRLSKISKLKPEEQGFIKVSGLSCNGRPAKFETNGTILEVDLPQAIQPNETVTLEMEWTAQVPLQTRRSGRDNREGVEFSMSQWYPKLCEYDYQGWHANPYVGREFYGVWGDFDVTIQMDRKYVVAAGGVLQNPDEVGYGYESSQAALNRPEGEKLTWHFVAKNVHDFVWAADPDFTQRSITAEDGSVMRFFWQEGKGYDEQWEKLPAIMDRARTLMNERFGKYPYEEYVFIQGGDGGMEYPMATLITGKRPLGSLVGVAAHEQLHSWYQMILGSNESLYPWMDEGFTSYAESIVFNELAREGLLGDREASGNPHTGSYEGYRYLANSGKEEPMTTHSDHYQANFAYGLAAYSKGAVFLHQLGYVIGQENLEKGLLRYYDTWKFKHPNPNDFIRVMEQQSGLELDWYKEDFVHTTNTIDYAVESVSSDSRNSTLVTISRRGKMAMPLDVLVTYKDGSQELFYAPLTIMRGEKPQESDIPRTVLNDHRWVDPQFTFTIPKKLNKVVRIEIDPSQRLADVDLEGNVWEKED